MTAQIFRSSSHDLARAAGSWIVADDDTTVLVEGLTDQQHEDIRAGRAVVLPDDKTIVLHGPRHDYIKETA